MPCGNTVNVPPFISADKSRHYHPIYCITFDIISHFALTVNISGRKIAISGQKTLNTVYRKSRVFRETRLVCHSVVTDFARFLGLSGSIPRSTEV